MQLNECIHGQEKDSNVGEREEDTLIDVDPDILPTMHIYPLHGGLLLISDSELQKQQQEAGKAPPESEQPPTQQVAKEKPFFPFFILILCFFVLFDMSDSAVTNLLSPIATITITPKAETLVTTATLPIVSLQGRVLPVLTLTQSQTTQATGKGHQDARAAAGILTFYNGLFTSEYVSIGTVFTGGDGVQVAT